MSVDGSIVKLSAPSHVGIVVKDLKEASEHYTSMWGLGPWTFLDNNPTKAQMLVGEPFKLSVCMAQWGPVVVELLQPIEGKSVWSDFLDTRGEGLHHICHTVPNFEEVVAQMQARGAKMLAGSWYKTIRWCYFETSPGGLVQEFIEEGDL